MTLKKIRCICVCLSHAIQADIFGRKGVGKKKKRKREGRKGKGQRERSKCFKVVRRIGRGVDLQMKMTFVVSFRLNLH